MISNIGCAEALAMLLLPLLAWSQPKIDYNLDLAQAQGLTVVLGTDPRFQELAKPVLQNPRSQMTISEGMKPFILLVKNTSTKAISMMAVGYNRTYLNRPPTATDVVVDTRGHTGPAFKPGDVVLVAPGIQVLGPNLAYMSPSAHTQVSNEFETAMSVGVVLDSVIFEDGVLVGPDNLGISVRYGAEMRAIEEVIASLHKLNSAGATAAQVREYGQSLAALRPQPSAQGEKLGRDTTFWHDAKLQTLGMRISSSGSTATLDDLITSLSQMHSRLGPVHR
jgi:hypothetical protein